MKKNSAKLGSLLTMSAILGLVLASCAPAVSSPTPAPTPKPTATSTAAPPAPTATTVGTRPTPTVAPATPAPPAAKSAEKSKSGGVLMLTHREDVPHFDMSQEQSITFQHALAPAYDLLVQYDPDDETRIVPDLAEKWDISADGTVYTFHLAKGVRFQDGQLFTSADVKATFERMVWPPKGIRSPRKGLFTGVKKIETPDDVTVTFTLEYPRASFLGVLAEGRHFIFPKHILDKKGDMTKDILGTGPFKLKEYLRGVSLEMAKNPDYFRPGRPYLDGLTRYIVTDPGASAAALRTGRVRVLLPYMHKVSPGEQEVLRKAIPNIVINSRPAMTQRGVMGNLTRKPWSDVRVRRAVDLALNRQAYVEVVLRAEGAVGGHFPPGTGWGIPQEELLKMPGFRPSKDADIAEAKRLLAEAGYAEGFKTRILVRSYDLEQRTAVFAKDQLARIGIDGTLDIKETAAYYQLVDARDFDFAFHVSGLTMPDPDAVVGEYYLSGAGMNYSGYRNPKVDELYKKQTTSADPQERKKIARELDTIFLQDVPFMVLGYDTYVLIHWPEVKNVRLGFTSTLFKKLDDVWLER